MIAPVLAMLRHGWIAALVLAGISVGVPVASAQQQKVGVDTAVNPDANGTPPGDAIRRLIIGQDVIYNERITTGATGQTQIEFLDQSSLTVGPNSDIAIDEFVYDPNTGTGTLTMSATRGVFRYIGGELSKNENAVTIRSGQTTIGIRGGEVLVNAVPGGGVNAIFIYGKKLTMTGASGCTQGLTRVGFELSVAHPGDCPSQGRAPAAGTIAGYLAQLDGAPGAHGGATTVPTDQIVAASGVSTTISDNVAASIQASIQTQLVTPQPQQLNIATVQNTFQVGIVQAQQPIQAVTTHPPTVVHVAGLYKQTNGANTGLGFVDQSVNGRIPYSNGTIAFPADTALQNGTAAITIPNQGQTTPAAGPLTLSPLTPGQTTTVTTTASNGFTGIGTALTAADNSFFYADLTSATTGYDGFIDGGTPVNQSFYAPASSPQVSAFMVHPDGALANGSQPQTIPFLPPANGGVMANAVVSPLYLAAPANQAFGSYNAAANPGGGAPNYLQASLAINGQGAAQGSALAVMTGSFNTSNSPGTVFGSGAVRGSYMANGTSPIVTINSGASTVPDGNGNNLFGGNSVEGFVLDQNQYQSQNFVPALASASPVAVGAAGVNYAFNQPVTAATLPATIGVTRSALSETGFFGGIMQTGGMTGTPLSYVLTGSTSVQTDPVSDRVAATFAGTDPFTSAESGIHSLVLNFGSLPASGPNEARSTFIDNNNYAALESPSSPSQINGADLPTANSATGSNLAPQLAMVTSATVPNASWMPSGVTPCACQYLQWGYWTGQAQTPNSTFTAATRTDNATVNTWIAGTPTVTMPTTGVAAYNGAAVGTVFNNGATYLAAGSFNQTYNFASQTGTATITNFDGAHYSAGISGSGNAFAGNLSGTPNRSGNISGSFYGPLAAEAGGTFSIRATAGSKYLASGIFAGR